MKYFSIKEVVRITGIKAHTLRTWELRYSFLAPGRKNGTRTYSLAQVKYLTEMNLLLGCGQRISKLALLGAAEIEWQVNQVNTMPVKKELGILKLVLAMYKIDTEQLDVLLDQMIKSYGEALCIEEIIIPFLAKIDIMWQGKCLDEEHYVVTAVRKRLICAIGNVGEITRQQHPVLLFIPGTGQLDLALLYANYRLAKKGVKVLYLGNDVTIDNLERFLQIGTFKFLFTYLPAVNAFPYKIISMLLKKYQPGCRMMVSTYPLLNDEIITPNIVFLGFNEAMNLMCNEYLAHS